MEYTRGDAGMLAEDEALRGCLMRRGKNRRRKWSSRADEEGGLFPRCSASAEVEATRGKLQGSIGLPGGGRPLIGPEEEKKEETDGSS